tara:strand:- start:201 stop:602 length:402 start_codon:yes stop_codon:yes gene_type:complete
MIFNGVFLTDPQALLSWWREEGLPVPTGADIKCHHVTSYFRPKGENKVLPYGEERSVKVVGFAYTPQIGAAVVETDIPSKNRFKHVTVFVNGVSPAKSNKLLEEGFKEVDGPTLSGRVGYFDGEDRFSDPGLE